MIDMTTTENKAALYHLQMEEVFRRMAMRRFGAMEKREGMRLRSLITKKAAERNNSAVWSESAWLAEDEAGNLKPLGGTIASFAEAFAEVGGLDSSDENVISDISAEVRKTFATVRTETLAAIKGDGLLPVSMYDPMFGRFLGSEPDDFYGPGVTTLAPENVKILLDINNQVVQNHGMESLLDIAHHVRTGRDDVIPLRTNTETRFTPHSVGRPSDANGFSLLRPFMTAATYSEMARAMDEGTSTGYELSNPDMVVDFLNTLRGEGRQITIREYDSGSGMSNIRAVIDGEYEVVVMESPHATRSMVGEVYVRSRGDRVRFQNQSYNADTKRREMRSAQTYEEMMALFRVASGEAERMPNANGDSYADNVHNLIGRTGGVRYLHEGDWETGTVIRSVSSRSIESKLYNNVLTEEGAVKNAAAYVSEATGEARNSIRRDIDVDALVDWLVENTVSHRYAGESPERKNGLDKEAAEVIDALDEANTGVASHLKSSAVWKAMDIKSANPLVAECQRAVVDFWCGKPVAPFGHEMFLHLDSVEGLELPEGIAHDEATGLLYDTETGDAVAANSETARAIVGETGLWYFNSGEYVNEAGDIDTESVRRTARLMVDNFLDCRVGRFSAELHPEGADYDARRSFVTSLVLGEGYAEGELDAELDGDIFDITNHPLMTNGVIFDALDDPYRGLDDPLAEGVRTYSIDPMICANYGLMRSRYDTSSKELYRAVGLAGIGFDELIPGEESYHESANALSFALGSNSRTPLGEKAAAADEVARMNLVGGRYARSMAEIAEELEVDEVGGPVDPEENHGFRFLLDMGDHMIDQLKAVGVEVDREHMLVDHNGVFRYEGQVRSKLDSETRSVIRGYVGQVFAPDSRGVVRFLPGDAFDGGWMRPFEGVPSMYGYHGDGDIGANKTNIQTMIVKNYEDMVKEAISAQIRHDIPFAPEESVSHYRGNTASLNAVAKTFFEERFPLGYFGRDEALDQYAVRDGHMVPLNMNSSFAADCGWGEETFTGEGALSTEFRDAKIATLSRRIVFMDSRTEVRDATSPVNAYIDPETNEIRPNNVEQRDFGLHGMADERDEKAGVVTSTLVNGSGKSFGNKAMVASYVNADKVDEEGASFGPVTVNPETRRLAFLDYGHTDENGNPRIVDFHDLSEEEYTSLSVSFEGVGDKELFPYSDMDPLNRSNMFAGAVINGRGMTDANVSCMGFGGWNDDDAMVVSKRWAEANFIVDDEGNRRGLAVGDKITDCHGNKGVISLVVDPEAPEFQGEDTLRGMAGKVFRENPELDIVMGPYSSLSRMNGGLINEMADNPVGNLVLDGEERNGGIVKLRMIISKETRHSFDYLQSNNRSRKLGFLTEEMAVARGAEEFFEYLESGNSEGVERASQFMSLLGYHLDAETGEVTAMSEMGEKLAGVEVLSASSLISACAKASGAQLEDSSELLGLATERADAQAVSDVIGSWVRNSNAVISALDHFDGYLEIPFEMKYTTDDYGATVALASRENEDGSTSWLLPVIKPELRRGFDTVSGISSKHDYTKRYADIFSTVTYCEGLRQWTDMVKAGTWPEDVAHPMLSNKALRDAVVEADTSLSVDEKTKLKKSFAKTWRAMSLEDKLAFAEKNIEAGEARVRSSFAALQTAVKRRMFPDSGHNDFKDNVFVGRVEEDGASFVITPNPELDLDTVNVSAHEASRVLHANEGDTVVILRDPTMQEHTVQAVEVQTNGHRHVMQTNPSVMSMFDGDYDGDMMAVIAGLPEQHMDLIQSRLGIANSLIDRTNGKESLTVKFASEALAIQYGTNEEYKAAMDGHRNNLMLSEAYRLPDGSFMGSCEAENREEIKRMSQTLRDARMKTFGTGLLETGGATKEDRIRSICASLAEGVNAGAKGKVSTYEMLLEYGNINLDYSVEDGTISIAEDAKVECVERGRDATTTRAVATAQIVKSDATGRAGSMFQRLLSTVGDMSYFTEEVENAQGERYPRIVDTWTKIQKPYFDHIAEVEGAEVASEIRKDCVAGYKEWAQNASTEQIEAAGKAITVLSMSMVTAPLTQALISAKEDPLRAAMVARVTKEDMKSLILQNGKEPDTVESYLGKMSAYFDNVYGEGIASGYLEALAENLSDGKGMMRPLEEVAVDKGDAKASIRYGARVTSGADPSYAAMTRFGRKDCMLAVPRMSEEDFGRILDERAVEVHTVEIQDVVAKTSIEDRIVQDMTKEAEKAEAAPAVSDTVEEFDEMPTSDLDFSEWEGVDLESQYESDVDIVPAKSVESVAKPSAKSDLVMRVENRISREREAEGSEREII